MDCMNEHREKHNLIRMYLWERSWIIRQRESHGVTISFHDSILMSFCTEDSRLKTGMLVGVNRNAARNESCHPAPGWVSRLQSTGVLGWWDGSVSKSSAARLKTWLPSLESYGGERELTLVSCPLTTIHALWCLHIHLCTHTHKYWYWYLLMMVLMTDSRE